MLRLPCSEAGTHHDRATVEEVECWQLRSPSVKVQAAGIFRSKTRSSPGARSGFASDSPCSAAAMRSWRAAARPSSAVSRSAGSRGASLPAAASSNHLAPLCAAAVCSSACSTQPQMVRESFAVAVVLLRVCNGVHKADCASTRTLAAGRGASGHCCVQGPLDSGMKCSRTRTPPCTYL